MEEEIIVLRPQVTERFQAAMERGRVVLFSAPCGFGKTTLATRLLAGRRVYSCSGLEPRFDLPRDGEGWDVLLVDDLQELDDSEQQAVCELIRTSQDKRFVLLTRGATPGWLMPFQFTGLMTQIQTKTLFFDRENTAQLLERLGTPRIGTELEAVQEVAQGYPLGTAILARLLAEGKPLDDMLVERARQALFYHLEEAVFRRYAQPYRQLMMGLSLFERFDLELARIVSGDSQVGEMLARIRRDSNMLLQEEPGVYRFWPLYRQFLLWELEQAYTEEGRRSILQRGGLYYELAEDYESALNCYERSGNHGKISELLVKNAQLHPGLGHYYEMERYYYALPEEEILASPALMQGMSMLCSMNLEFEQSERWYQALGDYAAGGKCSDQACREARVRQAWLDIALPQREVRGTLDFITNAFQLITARGVKMPPFSVTSMMPSVMNGGKDFSDWSKKDDLLYATMRRPVEAVLGRDGVGLAECAVAESKYEKGEDVSGRMLALMSRLNDIQRRGTPDMEFAVVGLLARTQTDAGRGEDAKNTIETLRDRFLEDGNQRFLPNIEAMLCRISLRLGRMDQVTAWYREKAPRNPQRVRVMWRYQYLTQAMAEIALEREGDALLTLAPLRIYCQDCRRHLDSIQIHMLSAIAYHRLDMEQWREELDLALDEAWEYRFIRPVANYGVAVLPLLKQCRWDGSGEFLQKVTRAARTQAVYYPDFMRPGRSLREPLTAAEQQVLRLLCADKSNGEIGEILGIRLPTVKSHVSHILQKLGVKRRGEVKRAAEQYRLL